VGLIEEDERSVTVLDEPRPYDDKALSGDVGELGVVVSGEYAGGSDGSCFTMRRLTTGGCTRKGCRGNVTMRRLTSGIGICNRRWFQGETRMTALDERL
jgi:hypothetical protein